MTPEQIDELLDDCWNVASSTNSLETLYSVVESIDTLNEEIVLPEQKLKLLRVSSYVHGALSFTQRYLERFKPRNTSVYKMYETIKE